MLPGVLILVTTLEQMEAVDLELRPRWVLSTLVEKGFEFPRTGICLCAVQTPYT